jgi:hypothetical protein
MHLRTITPARLLTTLVMLVTLWTRPAAAQVDQQRAQEYFREAAALCQREDGRLWGVSLCGPIAIADPKTGTIATSQTPPDAPRPAALGYANAAMNWGGTRWTTLVWQAIPADERERGILLIHELFHRVQPGLGLLVQELDNSHLDTTDGRYWLQLEWRALARALRTSDDARRAALQDALAFRTARQKAFPEAGKHEHALEINEGLAHYTGVVAGTASGSEALEAALALLDGAGARDTFVRTFPYVSGPAYGLLLDAFSPGWTRQFTAQNEPVQLLMKAADLRPAADAQAAATRYDGATLRSAEETRAARHAARVAELRRRFVDGPVIVLPRPRTASFVTTGMVPIPGAGTVIPTYRTTAEWGTLEAESVLMSADRTTIALPAPASPAGPTVTGEGWTLTLASGWTIRPGPRAGDFAVIRE